MEDVAAKLKDNMVITLLKHKLGVVKINLQPKKRGASEQVGQFSVTWFYVEEN